MINLIKEAEKFSCKDATDEAHNMKGRMYYNPLKENEFSGKSTADSDWCQLACLW